MNRLKIGEKIILWVYIFSFAFDFRGETGGSFIQFIFAGISLISGVSFYLYGRLFKHSSKMALTLKKIILLWWFYLLTTIVTAIISGVLLERYIRILFPYLLLGMSLLIIRNMQIRNINPYEILKPLLFAGIASTLWSIIYATSISGIDISSMRYQILSPALPFIIGYMFVRLAIRKQFDLFSMLILSIAIISILISVTRSFIIVFVFVMLGLVLISSTKQVIKRLSYITIIGAVIVISTWIVTEQLRPGFTQVWIDRIVNQKLDSGSDATYLTRLAEVNGQLNALTSDITPLLFGKGFGSEYRWDPKYFAELSTIHSVVFLETKMPWYPGHFMWIYSLYASGLLFGWIMPFIFLQAMFRSMLVARKLNLFNERLLQQLGAVPFFVILSYFGYSLTSNVLAPRFSALILGLMLGMAYWFSDSIEKTNHKTKKIIVFNKKLFRY
jgi:hypothetical protein